MFLYLIIHVVYEFSGQPSYCNDSLVESASSDQLLETAYVLSYDKFHEELSQFVGPFLSGKRRSSASINKDHRSKPIPQRKLNCFVLKHLFHFFQVGNKRKTKYQNLNSYINSDYLAF